jgi:hypothetical protein
MEWPESYGLEVYDFAERFLAVDHPELGVDGGHVWAYFVGREDEALDMRAEPTEAQRLPTKFALLGMHGLTGEPCLKLVPYLRVSGDKCVVNAAGWAGRGLCAGGWDGLPLPW